MTNIQTASDLGDSKPVYVLMVTTLSPNVTKVAVTSCILFHTPELSALAPFVFVVCGRGVSLVLALLFVRE